MNERKVINLPSGSKYMSVTNIKNPPRSNPKQSLIDTSLPNKPVNGLQNQKNSMTGSSINLNQKAQSTLNKAEANRARLLNMHPQVHLPFASFDKHELRQLGKRFKKLDSNNSGTLTLDEFMAIQPLQTNPLVSRILKIFDSSHDDVVDFQEFVRGMSLLSSNADKMSKLKFAFKIYDVDEDGLISNGELFQVIQLMVGDNLDATDLQQIVDKTIIYADKDGDGKVSFEEFCNAVGEHPKQTNEFIK